MESALLTMDIIDSSRISSGERDIYTQSELTGLTA